MPEEEGEDEADPDTHDPGHDHERQQTEVGERLQQQKREHYDGYGGLSKTSACSMLFWKALKSWNNS